MEGQKFQISFKISSFVFWRLMGLERHEGENLNFLGELTKCFFCCPKSFFFFISISDPQHGIRQKYQEKKRDEGWGGFWEMWIIGASLRWRCLKDHMLLNAFSALFPREFLRKTSFPVPLSQHWWIMLLMLLRTVLYWLCAWGLWEIEFSTGKKKKKEKKISWNFVEFWLNEPTSMLCNTDIWNNANHKTALTVILLTDEMTVPTSPQHHPRGHL